LKVENLKMEIKQRYWAAIVTVLLISGGLLRGGTAGADFEEVYELLRKNLAGASEAELERAAVQGLIQQLYPQVSVVTNAPASTNQGTLAATSVIEGAYGYFRFDDISEGIEKEFSGALKRLASTNRIKGSVLDLRFAEGTDYQAAAALADAFFTARRPLADWGEGVKFSTEKTNGINMPLAILVNNQTRGAAEAFAGILRRSEIGLLIGGNTAGQASISREFTLNNGQKLRVATTPVKVAGGQAIDRKGLKPDIGVEVSAAEERAFLENAYRSAPRPERLAATVDSTNQIAGAATNRTRRRITEADLVRMQREGTDLEADFVTGREAGPNRPPVITDPALARAIDLLKGLSVVHQFRSF
jgi:C-terminal processing protease CtpA/Prc